MVGIYLPVYPGGVYDGIPPCIPRWCIAR